MATYKIIHSATNKVVNLYSTTAAGAVSNGARLLLYAWENKNDQKWVATNYGPYVLLHIARDTSKVMNRHSGNNNAHVWYYDGTGSPDGGPTETDKDSVINTETTNGNTRIKLVYRGLYLTKNARDNYLSWASKIDSDRQYFKLEDISGGSTSGKGLNFLRPLDNSHPLTAGFNDYSNKGLDIDGAIGDPIRAAGYGKVLMTYSWRGATSGNSVDTIGNAVFIEHYNANGTVCGMTSYYHMNSFYVSANQIVQEGQHIGTVGNTGHVIAGSGGDGSHLHFALQIGSAFNSSSATTLYQSAPFSDPTPYIFRA